MFSIDSKGNLKGKYENFIIGKRELSVVLVEVVGMGEAGDILCDWLGEYIWLSLVGPKLEVGAKIREASSYGSSPGCLNLIAVEVVVWLPGLVAVEVMD